MSKTAKWILGILMVLVVLAILVAVGFFIYNRWSGVAWMPGDRDVRPWDGRRMMPIHPFWGMHDWRFGVLFPFRMMLGWLVFPGLLMLFVFGILALVIGMFRRRPATVSQAPISQPTPVQTPTRQCTMCNRPAQEDWTHCPYCGHSLL